LKLRTTPLQERAQRTVERILDTAGELIEEVGIDGFNTNLLAERSGLKVGSIYRYFPNKQAVMAALYERLTEEWQPFFEGALERIADPANDWREECDLMVDEFMPLLGRYRGAVAVRSAIRAEPSLVAIERADNDRLAQRFGVLMKKRIEGASRRDLERIARSWLNATSVLFDLALETTGVERRRQLDESKRLQCAYLAGYLD
jgi:AcrR family transcriptional regulator